MSGPAGREVLVEREAQVARLQGLLDRAAAGSGRVALVEGAPGVGKTALLALTRRMAGESGFTTLSGRGGELEASFGFGVARQLFEPLLRASAPAERERLLAGAARHAGPLLGFGEAGTPIEPTEPIFRALHGLYWLLSSACERAPVLLCVDDLQWSDVATLRFLDYLCGRVEALPVLVLATTLSVAPSDAGPAIARLRSAAVEATIAVPPLSVAGVATLIEHEFGAAAAPEFTGACHRLTGGNAFYLVQLMADARAQGLQPSAAAAERLERLVPPAIGRVVLAALARMDADSLAVARAIAILGDDVELRHAAALAGIELRAAETAADALAAASFLDGGVGLGFTHPIVARSVAADLPTHLRSSLHREAASLLAADAAPAERIAGHLLASAPSADPAAVETLRTAAAAALAAGAPEAAVSYLARALAEPPPPASRARVLEALGTAELLTGSPAAGEHLVEALASASEPGVRARIGAELATHLMALGRTAETIAQLDLLADELAGDPGGHDLGLRAHAIHFLTMTIDGSPAAAERLAGLPKVTGDDINARLICAARAFHDFAGCEVAVASVTASVLAATSGERGIEQLPLAHPAVACVLMPAVYSDEVGLALDLVERAMHDCTARGALMARTILAYWRASCHLMAGSVAAAEADARDSVELALANGWPMGVPGGAACLIAALVERGAVDEAETVLDMASSPSGEMPPWLPFTLLLEARAELRIAQGRLAEGLADMREVGRRHLRSGIRNPAVSSWRSRVAGLALRLGNGVEDLALVDDELALARRYGAARPLGIALRAAGELGQRHDALALLEESVAVLSGSSARLERARSAVALGSVLRRANRRADAREPLTQGMALARECGSTVLTAHARSELAATGARPRRLVLTGVESLTASERRVAEMAAAGASNPQIAQQLFVTRSTVESQLHAAYRKLGISGREDLAAALQG